jgi:restriction endonuclease S subunit
MIFYKQVEVKILKDVCESIQPGFAQGNKNVFNGVIHLRMNNIGTNFRLNFDVVRRILPSEEQLQKYRLKTNDIIFNNTNSSYLVGKSALFDEEGTFLYSNHLTRLRPNRRTVLPEWILFYLRYRWLHRDFERMCKKWINRAAISTEQLKNLEIPIKSLDIQKKVVEKVKSALNFTEQRKNQIIEIQKNNRLLLLNESNSFKRRLSRSNNVFDQLVQNILKSAFTGSLTSEYRIRNKRKYKLTEDLENNKLQTSSYEEIFHRNSKENRHSIPDEWKWTNINSVATFIGSGITPRGGKAVYVKSGVPFIRSQNVHFNRLSFHSFLPIISCLNLDCIFGCSNLKTSSPTDILFWVVRKVIFAPTFMLIRCSSKLHRLLWRNHAKVTITPDNNNYGVILSGQLFLFPVHSSKNCRHHTLRQLFVLVLQVALQ